MALTLTTNDIIIRKAGAGATAAITGTAATVTAIGEKAEGILIADTRRDWITDFASLNANTKHKVSDAVASKAALEIVANDRSFYLSGAEQTILLNLLTDEYAKAVKVLSDEDHNDIRSVS